MEYKVVPFMPKVSSDNAVEAAAAELEKLTNHMAKGGWIFNGLENVEMISHTPGIEGSSGCLGFGATPGTPARNEAVSYTMAVFSKER